ncbi:GDP-mannose mannosyl hydrolase [Dechloromonas sp. HYN0024]|uniref:GDP-mannose mannosyl hydrolase n=1 Tax=Dechloromonas sp. HYN0024 TaxID=2231055 RepID=UPI000E433706|nr:NUDIX domain-containing protein [Dechloromonas sp. HYN0024]AXS80119.1 NUDIX domain-containing protein [Dechloromonas sp. HYN0024]
MLDKADFLSVIDRTPLVAVDLIIVRDLKEVLLGLRKNRPAQGYWFVPGGRIFKNEKINDALIRVADSELGLGDALRRGEFNLRPMGSFEHFYPDCFAGNDAISTHYVVLGHRLDVPRGFDLLGIDEQHAEFRWWPVDEARDAAGVHRFTKDYLGSADFVLPTRRAETQ